MFQPNSVIVKILKSGHKRFNLKKGHHTELYYNCTGTKIELKNWKLIFEKYYLKFEDRIKRGTMVPLFFKSGIIV